jgi:hypothetical protein
VFEKLDSSVAFKRQNHSTESINYCGGGNMELGLAAILGIAGAAAVILSVFSHPGSLSVDGKVGIKLKLDQNQRRSLGVAGWLFIILAFVAGGLNFLGPSLIGEVFPTPTVLMPVTGGTATDTPSPLTPSPTSTPTLTIEETFESLVGEFFNYLNAEDVLGALTLTSPTFQSKVAPDIEDWVAYWDDRNAEIVSFLGGNIDIDQRGGELDVEVLVTYWNGDVEMEDHLVYTFLFVYLDEFQEWKISKVGNVPYPIGIE